MRRIFTILSTVILAGVSVSAADEVGNLTHEDACAILRDASQRAVRRKTSVDLDYEWTLNQVISAQIKAADFDGALETLKSYKYSYGRYNILNELAHALAANGQLDAAFNVLSRHPDYENHRSRFEDEARLHWIDRLIARGQLREAAEQIGQFKSKANVSDALQKLATAHDKAGQRDLAIEEFSQAIKSAETPRDMLKIAKAQLALEQFESVTDTIRQVVQSAGMHDAWTKINMLAESAVILAKVNDHVQARQFFEQATENVKGVNGLNKVGAITAIAKSQAAAGYFDDALRTLSPLRQDTSSTGSERDHAISTVAISQFESGNPDAAVQTALSIQPHPQYRDEAFQRFAELQIAMNEFAMAIVSAARIEEDTIRVSTRMKVAVALVIAGDKKAAMEIADRVEIVSKEPFAGGVKFDFHDPQSWGRNYQSGFTNVSRRWAIKQTAEVAAMAMTLFVKLGLPNDVSFATAFKEFDREVIRSLARAHAASGSANEALTWCKQLETIKSYEFEDDDHQQNRHIYALIGVAEGILDRTSAQRR